MCFWEEGIYNLSFPGYQSSTLQNFLQKKKKEKKKEINLELVRKKKKQHKLFGKEEFGQDTDCLSLSMCSLVCREQ